MLNTSHATMQQAPSSQRTDQQLSGLQFFQVSCDNLACAVQSTFKANDEVANPTFDDLAI